MSIRRLVVEGAASVETAWLRYLEPARWPGWSPQIRRVETSSERLVPGLSGVVHALGGVRVPFTVVAVDAAAHTWSWMARLGPATVTMHHGVEPGAHGRGSRTTLVLESPAPLLLGYTPVARLALRRLVAP